VPHRLANRQFLGHGVAAAEMRPVIFIVVSSIKLPLRGADYSVPITSFVHNVSLMGAMRNPAVAQCMPPTAKRSRAPCSR
jgi:hypothetical protein